MSENIPAKGTPTPIQCAELLGRDPAGSSNFVAIQLGGLTCDSKGTCKGVITNVANPCPNVDAVQQVVALNVYDGPAAAVIDNVNGSGVTLKKCCGLNQNILPGSPAAEQPGCQGVTQDVLAAMGAVVQIK
jgi:hypothetical protein